MQRGLYNKRSLKMETGTLILIIALAINFLPTIIACSRRHRNRLPIVFLNICTFAGGTVLMFVAPIAAIAVFAVWFFALVWAMTCNVEEHIRVEGDGHWLWGSPRNRAWSDLRPANSAYVWERLKAKPRTD
jgi:hypothetical protein